MKSFFILGVVVLLLLPFCFADGTTRYPYPSGVGQDWNNEGRGNFGFVQEDYDTYGKSLSSPYNMPIIDDFDNNSVSEMVIIDGDTARVYQNKELDFVSSVDFGTDPTAEISNILSYDIDDDGFNEIIFADEHNGITILNYTQADGMQIQTQITEPLFLSNFPMIACRYPNDCLITLGNNIRYNYIQLFNSTNTTTGVSQVYDAGSGNTICIPRTKNIITKDYDNDGKIEFIFSFADDSPSGEAVSYHVVYMDNLTVEQMTSDDSGTIDDLVHSCVGENSISNLFTSPVVDDLYTAYSNDETFIAVQVAQDDFRIWVYSADGIKRQQHPDIATADGVIISNLVIGNFFPETNTDDICVMGYVDYDPTDFPDIRDQITLLCGTEDRPFPLFNSDEFKYDTTGTFNISSDVRKMDIAVHGVQHSNEETNLNDLDEIISAYGIFTLDYELINELERLWENPAGDSVILSVDFEQSGVDDIIAMTDTNILYYDDRLSNEPAQIDEITYNPCVINSIIKVNTTLQIQVDARDTNDAVLGYDKLNFNIYIYEGTTNEMNYTARNVTTSQVDGTTTVIAQFIVNKTGINNNILVEVWDNANPTEIATDEQLFSVGLEGLEFGDVVCSKELVPLPDTVLSLPAECHYDDDCPNGYVCIDNECIEIEESLPVTAMQEASGIFRIGITALWLMFMLALAIGFWFAPLDRKYSFFDSANARLGAILIGEIIMLILGTVFGFLHPAIIISLIILCIVVIGIWITKKFANVGA